ncbi:hypothetical protein KIH74_27035 [Kineosporia sp. J2-2]|uniref:Uncharacterized protein n=1 Tax=Kineosporia corallincola TaxID=2835133 RepID=A0ABS5TP73_9ACTN|nr:hypothetical protein [Kineosporia corallincola]MBT0772628.1 hypothetical protein [Kineosporia corallincola]
MLNFSGLMVVAADDLVSAVDAAAEAGRRHLLIAVPAALAAQARLRITIAAGRHPLLEQAVLISGHAPLAIMSAVTSARSVTDHPVLGVDLVHRLLAHSWSGAWTPTVSKLGRPAPSMGQHLRSLLPGPGFLVRQGDDPEVFNAVRPGVVERDDLDRVLLVSEGGVPRSVSTQLAQVAGAGTVRPVRMPGRWTGVYGTARAGQTALLPARPAAFLARPAGRCPSCRLEQPAEVCPFCHVLVETTTTAGGIR